MSDLCNLRTYGYIVVLAPGPDSSCNAFIPFRLTKRGLGSCGTEKIWKRGGCFCPIYAGRHNLRRDGESGGSFNKASGSSSCSSFRANGPLLPSKSASIRKDRRFAASCKNFPRKSLSTSVKMLNGLDGRYSRLRVLVSSQAIFCTTNLWFCM
jgi:hypothetical protein